MLQQRNLRAIFDHLERTHGFPLTEADENSIKFVYTSFYLGGPDLRYSFPRSDFAGPQWFPTYAELMVQTDLRGENHSYIASAKNFAVLQEYEKNNLIVPLVGDFGGDHAIRAVGQYLKDHDATVTAFYTSNVEQYLFQGDPWKKFFANVAHAPPRRAQHVHPRLLQPDGLSLPDERARAAILDAAPADPRTGERLQPRRNPHLLRRRLPIEVRAVRELPLVPARHRDAPVPDASYPCALPQRGPSGTGPLDRASAGERAPQVARLPEMKRGVRAEVQQEHARAERHAEHRLGEWRRQRAVRHAAAARPARQRPRDRARRAPPPGCRRAG